MRRVAPVLALMMSSFVLVDCTAEGSPSASPQPLAPPSSLDARNIKETSLTLTWEAPPGTRPQSYAIKRDGVQVAEVDGSTLRYTDTDLWPATKYRYALASVRGSEVASAKSFTVKTRTPPLSQARMEGRWTVVYTVISSSLSNAHPGQPLRPYVWSFKPNCSSGACGGRWTIHFRDLRHAQGVFNPLGEKYTGKMTNESLGFCGGVNDVMDDATAEMKITKAATRDGDWTALTFEGIYREYFPSENGCISSFLYAKIDGRRNRGR